MPTGELNYQTFCDMVTGYRRLAVIMAAVDSGLIDTIGSGNCDAGRLLAAAGMEREAGLRFLGLLAAMGILERDDCGELRLSPFAATYLHKESRLCQQSVLAFEKLLIKRWGSLGEQLKEGQGKIAAEPSEEGYRRRLALFHKAMGEAALVRGGELWEAMAGLPQQGVIVDAGAGDGTYLSSFLARFPAWQALACDLPDVLALHSERISAAGIASHPCNLLDPAARKNLVAKLQGKADLLLLSNFIHCYSREENAAMLADLALLPNNGGRIVIHDFFSDANPFSSLYDLHMLVNTYNGRTYTFAETEAMLEEAGLCPLLRVALPSSSHAVIACRR